MKNNIIEITINACKVEELEVELSGAIEDLTRLHTLVKRDADKNRREAAFIRYCFTGKFE